MYLDYIYPVLLCTSKQRDSRKHDGLARFCKFDDVVSVFGDFKNQLLVVYTHKVDVGLLVSN